MNKIDHDALDMICTEHLTTVGGGVSYWDACKFGAEIVAPVAAMYGASVGAASGGPPGAAAGAGVFYALGAAAGCVTVMGMEGLNRAARRSTK